MAGSNNAIATSRLEVVEYKFAEIKDEHACWVDHTFAFTFDHEDHLDLGHFIGPKPRFTEEQLAAALERMPDEHFFLKLPLEFAVTVAGEPTTGPRLHLKRPNIVDHHFIQQDVDDDSDMPTDSIANWFRDEVQAFQLIAQHPPHPHIVKYHGCRVRRGLVTGIVMEAVDEMDLNQYVKAGNTLPDKEGFLTALESALHHLHEVVGIAHNDIKPSNIMVRREDGMPVLIDFGSASPLGARGWGPIGTDGWMETDDYLSYAISKASHDIWGLNKLRTWLDKPEFSESELPLTCEMAMPEKPVEVCPDHGGDVAPLSTPVASKTDELAMTKQRAQRSAERSSEETDKRRRVS